MQQHRRRNKPNFVQLFEADLLAIDESTEHPAPSFLVWMALCRLENVARAKREDSSFTLPIKNIGRLAGLKYRATLNALNHLEELGLVRITRKYSSPGNRQPDSPSTYEICGALREYEIL
jgi:hypothetical protein